MFNVYQDLADYGLGDLVLSLVKINGTLDLPNKRQRQTPRKSSTNTRALSTRISNIQKEINPYIHLSGNAVGTAQAMYIDRVAMGEFILASGTADIKASQLNGIIPDGGKILSMKVINVSGRKLRVKIPALSPLTSNNGPTGNSNAALEKVAYAPLSRFPTLKVEIPDLLATNLDTNGTASDILFSVYGAASDVITIRFHYKQAI